MDAETKKSCQRRLARVEGQVRGVHNMLEEERYCMDILTQIHAVSGALESLKQIILREHMQQCVTDAFHNGSLRERREKINELIRLFDGHYR
ncbi:MAG: metal-sensitive transcriptional regulator [Pseudomonadota bacterium]|jgi:CsoR family transcriptional regulator, copper-sensing transcriptional repressor|nr:transcriptional regulator [Alphaproteobacteria bacterium]